MLDNIHIEIFTPPEASFEGATERS
jgi:hypothetical protein